MGAGSAGPLLLGYGLRWTQWWGNPSKPGHRFGYAASTPGATGEPTPAGEASPIAPPKHTRRHAVIYIEHHDGPEQTEVGRIDWRPGWYAICDECGWMAGPCRIEADAHAAADAHDLAMGR